MRDVFKNRDSKIVASKKKNVLLWSVVGILVTLLIISALMSIDMSTAMKAARANNESAPDIEAMADESGTKESWAISVENRLDAISQANEQNTKEMSNTILNAVSEQSKLFTEQLTHKVEQIDKKLEKQTIETARLQKEIQATKLQQLSNIEALQNQITEAVNKVDSIKMMPPPPLAGNDVDESESSIFDSLSISPVIRETLAPSNKLTYSVSTASNNFKDINATQKDEKKLTKEELAALNTYEIVTGFTEAYMITGAYAPLFAGGSAGGSAGGGTGNNMMAVPVLLEAEGDLIMPNNTIGSVDKCMLIGTAIGNAASNTVDIRLEKMTCLIAGGKKIIDGKISGWVVSEVGSPGVPAKLIYRAGDYISRVIGSGVLEGLSQGFINAAAAGTYGGGQSGMVYSGAVNGASNGVSNAFSKLADLYLSLAEQTLPMLSAKGGRSVSMVLEGGDKFKMRDINLLDTREVEYYVDEFIGEN